MSKILRNLIVPTISRTLFVRFSSTESTSHEYASKKKSNVDEKDVKHHSSFKLSWWDPNGPMRPLHELNKLRVPLVKDGLINVGHKPISHSNPLKGVTILDVACGGGLLSEPLARLGATVTGVDASSELIDLAKEHSSLDSDTSGISYIHSTVEELADTHNEKFDAVVASEIIEHVIDKKSFLKACTHLLKPGGSIFITTLNKTVPSLVGAVILAEYVFAILPRGTHNWEQFISPEDTRRMLNELNCDTKLIHGMFYDVIKRQWCWVSSTMFCYALQAVKSKASRDD